MIHHIKVSYTLSRYYNIVNPGTRRSHLLIKENTNERDLPRRFPLALREWRKLGWMLPNPPFLSSLHIGRSYVNRVVRRIEAQKNERTAAATITNRTHVSHRACEVCFIRRQLVFPGFRGLIVPRLRESGGAKVRIRGGNQRSTVILIKSGDEIGLVGNRSKRSWKEQRETQKLGEGESAARLEEFFTFPQILYESSRISSRSSRSNEERSSVSLLGRFVKGMRFTNWLITHTVNHRTTNRF